MVCRCCCYARACLVNIEVNNELGALHYHFPKQASIYSSRVGYEAD